MPPVVYTANLDYYDFARAPWPWELGNPLTVDEYFAWALSNGRVPAAPLVATGEPAPGGPSGADCTALARWMGETLQRRRQADTIINSSGQAAFPDEQVATGFEEDAGALAILAAEQEESNPSTAAVALNAVLVQEYETYAEGATLLRRPTRWAIT